MESKWLVSVNDRAVFQHSNATPKKYDVDSLLMKTNSEYRILYLPNRACKSIGPSTIKDSQRVDSFSSSRSQPHNLVESTHTVIKAWRFPLQQNIYIISAQVVSSCTTTRVIF